MRHPMPICAHTHVDTRPKKHSSPDTVGLRRFLLLVLQHNRGKGRYLAGSEGHGVHRDH